MEVVRLECFLQALSGASPDRALLAKLMELIKPSVHNSNNHSNHSNHNNHNQAGGKWRKHVPPAASERKRPVIGGGPHKELMALLNKLSPSNVDKIVKGVQAIYVADHLETYIQVMWDLMQRQPDYQPLYIQVLRAVATKDELVEGFGRLYEVWRLDVATESPVVEEGYDGFCDYVKWKKRKEAAGQGLMRLILDGLVLSSPLEYISTFLVGQEPSEHTIEQLIAISQLMSPMQRRAVAAPIRAACQMWAGAKDRCRFKLMDLRDMYGAG